MAGHLHRLFVILSLIFALLFNLTSYFSLKATQTPMNIPVFQLVASKISSATFLKLLGTGIPYLTQSSQGSHMQKSSTFTQSIFQSVTGITPGDPIRMIGTEIPGTTILTANWLQQKPAWKVESPAPVDLVEKPLTLAEPDKDKEVPKENTQEPVDQSKSTKKVLIYHSHNRESWLNISKRTPGTAAVDHPTKNITLVGKHLVEALNEQGVGTEFIDEDIYQQLVNQGKSFPFSYAQSLKSITAATENNRHLYYFFDLHRDDTPREKTTITINGKTYARLMFVIGKRNPSYKENLKIANELNERLEKKYPGLSRGVDDKGKDEGNGEYNQHVSPGSLLLEVGGIGNTIEECLNTVEAYADVFAEYFWQAERA